MNTPRAALVVAAVWMCGAMAAQITLPANIVSVFPKAGDEAATRDTVVSATFDQPMGTPDADTFIVRTSRTGDAVLAGSYSGGRGPTVSFTPSAPFQPGDFVNVTITTGMTDAGGIAIVAGRVWRFRVAASAAGIVTPDFSLAPPIEIAPYSVGAKEIAAADLNGDGLVDVIAHTQDTSTGKSGVTMLLRQTTATGAPPRFQKSAVVAEQPGGGPPNTRCQGLRTGDMDGDGSLDAVVLNFSGDANLARNFIYFNDGHGGFSDTNVSEFGGDGGTPELSMALVLADLNADGELDIACITALGVNNAYLNRGAGRFNFASDLDADPACTRRISTTGDGGAIHALDAADFDLDGDIDLVLGFQNGTSSNFVVCGNSGRGGFPVNLCLGATITAGVGTNNAGSLWSAVAGDFDGDGAPDVVTGGKYGSAVLFNGGAGVFSASDRREFGSGADNVYVMIAGDVNGDDALDVLLVSSAPANGGMTAGYAICYLNDGAGISGFGTHQGVMVDLDLTSGQLADMDGDGDNDVITANIGPLHNDTVIYVNGGYLTLDGRPVLPKAEEGAPYLLALRAKNGTAPYVWAAANPADAVWSWLTLSASGELSGMPPAGGQSYAFDIIISDAGGRSAPVTCELYVKYPATRLPWGEDFELADLGQYSSNGGVYSQASIDGGWSTGSAAALRLDTLLSDGYWNVTQAQTEDPAGWNALEPHRTGTLEWNVNGAGVTDVEIEFDYAIVNYPGIPTAQPAVPGNPNHYANFSFEWSDDGGLNWTVATGGANATTQGVYRGDTAWQVLHDTIAVSGLAPVSGDLRFRLHWLVRWNVASSLPTYIVIDNVSIVAGTSAPPVPPPPAPAAPSISGISPASGPDAGGTPVTIAGANLDGAGSVTFGGIPATIVSNTSTSIEVLTPVHAPGLANVAITTPGGTASLVQAFEFTAASVPAIASISPASGPLAGGTPVVIRGSGFDGAISVSFGGAAAAITASSPVMIEVTAPAASAAGSVDVVITTANGPAALTAGYTYADNVTVPPPVTPLNAEALKASAGCAANRESSPMPCAMLAVLLAVALAQLRRPRTTSLGTGAKEHA